MDAANSAEDRGYAFRVPLAMLVAPYTFMIVSAMVDKCLRNWYKKHEKMKEQLRAQRLQEVKESAKKEQYVPVGYPLKNCSCHNIEPHYIFIWLSVVSLAGAVIGFWTELENHNLPRVGRRFFILLAVALSFHSVLMFVVLVGKLAGVRLGNHIQCLAEKPRKPVDEDGKRFVIFTIGLEGFKKVLFATVGLLFRLIDKVLEELSSVLDLHIFWIPSAFFSLAKKKEIIKNMKIDYRTVTYDLDFGDAYLRFCYEKVLNLLTFTIWNKLRGKYYRQWLDKHIRFVGEPPEICNNNFEYHQARPSIQAYVKAYPLILTGICAICGQYILFKDRVRNMRLGGVKMVLKKSFTMAAWIKLHLKTFCALRQDAFTNELDDNVQFAGAVATQRVQQLTQCAYVAQPATESPTTTTTAEVQPTKQKAVSPQSEHDMPEHATNSTSVHIEDNEMTIPVENAYPTQSTSTGEPKEEV